MPVGGLLARLNGGAAPAMPPAPDLLTSPAAPPVTAAAPTTTAPPVTAPPLTAPPVTAPPVTVPPREEHAMPPVSPVLRHRAHELGVDLATVRGTGRRGAITRGDLELAAQGRAAALTPSAAAPAVPTPETPARQRVTPYARRLARERGADVRGIPGTGPSGAVRADDVLRAATMPAAPPAPTAPPAPPPPPAPSGPHGAAACGHRLHAAEHRRADDHLQPGDPALLPQRHGGPPRRPRVAAEAQPRAARRGAPRAVGPAAAGRGPIRPRRPRPQRSLGRRRLPAGDGRRPRAHPLAAPRRPARARHP